MQQFPKGVSKGMEYQLAIYEKGLKNIRPGLPLSYEGLEQMAKEVMRPEAFDYVAGGAGAETSVTHNRNALDRWKIVPRMMTNVSGRQIDIELFGRQYSSPVFLAPIGVLGIVHPEAEVGVAQGVTKLQVPQIVSTVSSVQLETIAAASGNDKWFQLYWGSNNDFTKSILQRAEKSGYKAIVVTLDTRIFAWRNRDIANAYLPFLYGEGLANYISDPVFLSLVGDPAGDARKTMMCFAQCFANPSSTWRDLEFLKSCTNLPILVKGILHPDDAREAIDHGADGIIVSNHGGRQMDGCIGALDALPGVVEKTRGKVPILFDSGIRTGADVFKAMALGASGVLLGRPYAFGLAIGGAEGVENVVANLLADIELTLGLAGLQSWKEVGQDALVKL